MTNKIYHLNKGVNRPIEFRGLKAQYIWYLGGGIVGLLAGFAGLYIAGVNPFICLITIGSAGLALFRQVYQMNRRYGRHGLMKKQAARNTPKRIRAGTRKPFMGTRNPYDGTKKS